jgi:hypothetical protein
MTNKGVRKESGAQTQVSLNLIIMKTGHSKNKQPYGCGVKS